MFSTPDENGYHSISINPSYITTWYNSFHHKRRFHTTYYTTPDLINPNTNSLDNLKHNLHSGHLSKMAVKKISKALDYSIYLAKPPKKFTGLKGKHYQYCLNFITLTLSSKQIHSDLEIKTKIFQPLLDYFRKHYHFHNYVWVIEKQKNGNTHFHVVGDKWIPHAELRNLWNKYQQNLGYVSRYTESQKRWFKNGFHVREDLLKTWNYNKQYNAWLAGCKCGWSNPNSTDVHSLRFIDNVKKYMIKYFTKNYTPIEKKLVFEPTDLEQELLKVDNFSKISGRIWGCSESLSHIKGARYDVYEEIANELQRVKDDSSIHSLFDPYFSIHYVDIEYLRKMNFTFIPRIFDEFVSIRFPAYSQVRSLAL
jgi:hypothetical protein